MDRVKEWRCTKCGERRYSSEWKPDEKGCKSNYPSQEHKWEKIYDSKLDGPK